MSDSGPQLISSRDNALLKNLRRLAQHSTAYRKEGQIWLEGDHLCQAALGRGVKPLIGVFAESFWQGGQARWQGAAQHTVVVADSLFAGLSGIDSPAGMGFVVALPEPAQLAPHAPSVILDRVQDAGNVGAILRSAAAFGFTQLLALKGTAALWSAKVLRSAMGAHFGLKLIEGIEPQALEALAIPILATSSHQGEPLQQLLLPWPCAWAFGNEGQGLADEVAFRAGRAVRIVQPGGEESLNVAAAAAICLHASASARQ